jgi:hypothetical protein
VKFPSFYSLLMTLSSSHDLEVNVPYVHLLSEYRSQPKFSLPPVDNLTFLACCVLSEKLRGRILFLELPYYPLDTNTQFCLYSYCNAQTKQCQSGHNSEENLRFLLARLNIINIVHSILGYINTGTWTSRWGKSQMRE